MALADRVKEMMRDFSTDGGQTWSPEARVANGKGGVKHITQVLYNDKPYLVAWGQGNAFVTWVQYHIGPLGV